MMRYLPPGGNTCEAQSRAPLPSCPPLLILAGHRRSFLSQLLAEAVMDALERSLPDRLQPFSILWLVGANAKAVHDLIFMCHVSVLRQQSSYWTNQRWCWKNSACTELPRKPQEHRAALAVHLYAPDPDCDGPSLQHVAGAWHVYAGPPCQAAAYKLLSEACGMPVNVPALPRVSVGIFAEYQAF